MRSIPLFLLLMFLYPASSAQAQDVLDVIANDACGCVTDLKDQELDQNAYQMQLGLCLIKHAQPHEKELRKKYKIDLSSIDGAEGERLGELVGMRLVVSCPEFMNYVTSLQAEEEAASEAVEIKPATVHGSVTGVRQKQFLMIQVKDDSGRTLEMLRLEHFPNADLLSDAGATDLKGSFQFVEKELYDPVSGSYRRHNILVGLEPD